MIKIIFSNGEEMDFEMQKNCNVCTDSNFLIFEDKRKVVGIGTDDIKAFIIEKEGLSI